MIETIHIKNFKSHKNTKIEFKKGFNIIIGPNGSGKSSIVDSIVITLLGLSKLNSKKDDLNRDKSKENKFSVILKVNVLGNNYIIEKSYDKLKINNNEIKEDEFKKIVPTNLLRALIVRQNEIKDLMNQENASEVVAEFSRVKILKSLLSSIKELKRDLDKEIELVKKEKEFILNELKNLFPDKANDFHIGNVFKLIEEVYVGAREKYEKTKKSLDNLEEKFVIEDERIKSLKKELSKLEEDLEELNRLEKLLIEEEYKLRTCNNEINIKKENINNLKGDLDKLKEELKNSPEIKRKFEELLGIEKIIEELNKLKFDEDSYNRKKEEIKNIEGELKKKKALLIKIESELAKYKNIKENFEKIRYEKELYEKNKDYLRNKKKIIENYNNLISNEERLNKIKEKKIKVLSRLKELEEKMKNLNNLDKKDLKNCPTCLRPLDKDSLNNVKKHINGEIEELKLKLDSINKLINKYEPYMKKKDIIIKQFYYLKELESSLRGFNEEKFSRLKKEYEEYEKLLKNKDLIENEIHLITKNYDNIRQDLEKIGFKKKIFEKLNEELNARDTNILDEKDKIRESYFRIKELEKNKSIIENKINELNDEILEKSKEKDVLKENIMKYSNRIKEFNRKIIEDKIKSLRDEIEFKNEELKKIISEISKKKADLEILHKELVILDKFKKKLSEIRSKEELNNENYEKLNILLEGLDKYLKYQEKHFFKALSIKLGKILDFLTDGKLSKVRIEKYEERGREKYKFEVLNNGVYYKPENLSGGEQTIFSLAMRLAIAEIANREGFNFLVLDEPTIHLDKITIRKFINYLADSKSFKQLIIVSHDREFESIADNLIELNKNPEGYSEAKNVNI